MKIFWNIAAILTLLGPAGARAQSTQVLPTESRAVQAEVNTDPMEEAKGLFRVGKAAFEAGRFAEALTYFKRSHAISQRAELLYNIGLAADRLRDDQQALEAFERYLDEGPSVANHDMVVQRVAALRAALARERSSNAARGTTAVASPTEAAQAWQAQNPSAAASTSDLPASGHRSDRVISRWWFWTLLGVVVVGGGVTAGVLASNAHTEVDKAATPNTGITVRTLELRP